MWMFKAENLCILVKILSQMLSWQCQFTMCYVCFQIQNMINSLRSRVARRVHQRVHRQKRMTKAPIEIWAELAQKVTGVHQETISSAFSKVCKCFCMGGKSGTYRHFLISGRHCNIAEQYFSVALHLSWYSLSMLKAALYCNENIMIVFLCTCTCRMTVNSLIRCLWLLP